MFEPTYEELKGFLNFFILPRDISLSLPMRNWKKNTQGANRKEIRVWAYLWGIESLISLGNLPVWNSFEPTYEELKEIKN